MHLKELNHRSPMRMFERSVQGGLGRGNLGLVAARAGVGKTGFLTSIALDDLLRGKRVLHVATDQRLEHVRDFYDEIFADLARTANLEETLEARRQVETGRIIQTTSGRKLTAASLRETIDMLGRSIDFKPDVLVLDSPEFAAGPLEDIRDLCGLARDHDVEVWLSVRTRRTDDVEDWHVMPEPAGRLADLVAIVVVLQPIGDAVRIRLLKDHEKPQPADLSLEFDPRTLLVRES